MAAESSAAFKAKKAEDALFVRLTNTNLVRTRTFRSQQFLQQPTQELMMRPSYVNRNTTLVEEEDPDINDDTNSSCKCTNRNSRWQNSRNRK